MSEGRKTTRLWACMAAAWLLLCTAPVTWADDCKRAEELYDQAVQLMNYEERRDAFQRAVDLCPAYAGAHINLADAFENLGKFEEAERHYGQALQHKPDFHLPYIGLGEVYLKTGRFGLAREAFEQGLRISPSDQRMRDGMKVVEERMRREQSLFKDEQIVACLVEDEDFRLMCMCPTDHYEYLRKWVCIPAIFFSAGSSSLSTEAVRQLDEIGRALKSDKLTGKEWSVIGHADNTGDPEYNVQLSKARAAKVRRYLVERHGLNPKSLDIKFLGQVFPRASNNTTGGRCENRRVEIVAD
ncbi:MAG: OmpA family protein [Desulfomonilaceae bacterium]